MRLARAEEIVAVAGRQADLAAQRQPGTVPPAEPHLRPDGHVTQPGDAGGRAGLEGPPAAEVVHALTVELQEHHGNCGAHVEPVGEAEVEEAGGRRGLQPQREQFLVEGRGLVDELVCDDHEHSVAQCIAVQRVESAVAEGEAKRGAPAAGGDGAFDEEGAEARARAVARAEVRVEAVGERT